jgi:protein-L-isoaspartate(D-aspartate) O-methyltransferase
MYESERQELVNKIKEKGISDAAVLKAIENVERHLFVPKPMIHHAYKDAALPIGQGQTISQPYTVAYMTQALNIKEGQKVLEIGTGSGYQAAILADMGTQVYTIERNLEIYNETMKLFDRLGIRVHARYGDGSIGWQEYAPYDGIIVTAGAPSIPNSLMKQLTIGGRLVIPVGGKDSQILKIVTRISEDNYQIKDVPEFSFVPLIGREGWREK